MKAMTPRAAKMAQKKLISRIGRLNAIQHTHGIAQSERDEADAELRASWAEVARLEAIINPAPVTRTDSMFS